MKFVIEKEKTMEKSLYVAIDSNVLWNLATLDKEKKVERYEIYKNILDNVKNGTIKLLITKSVYAEAKRSSDYDRFIKKYCYFPKRSLNDVSEIKENENKLAWLYCASYMKEGERKKAPMKLVYSSEVGEFVPSNDAHIMAEATVEGCYFITENKKDFIFDFRNPNMNRDRAIGIATINFQNGFYTSEEGNTIIPKPIEPFVFSNILQKDKSDWHLSLTDDNKRVKVKELLHGMEL